MTSLNRRRIQIVHLKLMDKCATGYIKVGVCANHEQPSVEGTLDASPALRHELLLNVRAGANGSQLGGISEDTSAHSTYERPPSYRY
jgi:hypothetical protein